MIVLGNESAGTMMICGVRCRQDRKHRVQKLRWAAVLIILYRARASRGHIAPPLTVDSLMAWRLKCSNNEQSKSEATGGMETEHTIVLNDLGVGAWGIENRYIQLGVRVRE